MHHYGEDSTDVKRVGDVFDVTFRNKVTQREIHMRIPSSGALSDSTKQITQEEVEDLAREISHTLRNRLA